jgi:acetolactate synthase I/II/III large subunit
MTKMNGAQGLIRTLVACDIDVCFTNPGTSEMHFVAALDTVPEMRGVLGLFEGVATGAADGFARMADRPAATLLHLGPGLANGMANLHNARKARVPLVNIVGDHASYHKQYDAQLESDIETAARNVSPHWVRFSRAPDKVGHDAAEAVAAALGPPGQVATLVLPADVSWLDGGQVADPVPPSERTAVAHSTIDDIAQVLRSDEPAALLLGGAALREPALLASSRVANAADAKLLCETFPTRLERGAGLPPVERIAYLAEMAMSQLEGLRHLVVVDSKPPVSFFAYPNKPSYLVPEGCQVHTLAEGHHDVVGALEALADAIDPSSKPALQTGERPAIPTGALDAATAAQALGALLPEGAIVSDEGNTSGIWMPMHTAGAPRHDWLTLTGGAIGQGMPLAVGAAVACPDRKVVNLEADGSALYTLQALWTQARESLDVVTILLNNRSYAVLNMELNRVGAEPGPKARSLLDLSQPDMDFVALATGLGVPATRATTADELSEQLARALAEPGPSLIEAMVPAPF